MSAMTITLTPELERAVIEHARRNGLSPEELALRTLLEKFSVPVEPQLSQEEWERFVQHIGKPRGIALPDEAFSREELYD